MFKQIDSSKGSKWWRSDKLGAYIRADLIQGRWRYTGWRDFCTPVEPAYTFLEAERRVRQQFHRERVSSEPVLVAASDD